MQGLAVTVVRSTVEGPTWSTRYDVRVQIEGALTVRERTILLNSARHCEVHKLLTGAIEFHYE